MASAPEGPHIPAVLAVFEQSRGLYFTAAVKAALAAVLLATLSGTPIIFAWLSDDFA